MHIQIEMIRAWLHRIGEPEGSHFLVIDKCRRDPEALAYFLKHATTHTNEALDKESIKYGNL